MRTLRFAFILRRALLGAFIPGVAWAQSASSPADEGRSVEPEVTLSPFEVTISTDEYTTTNTQVATGFNRELKRTPLAVNVITQQFIRDAGFTSYSDLADYLPNAYVEASPLDGSSTSYARGHGTSFYSQDGRRFYTDPIIAAGGQLEVIKGPATLFFGRAQPGGIFNFSTPPPSARRMTQLTASYGSYDNQNVSLASQGRIIPGKDWLTYRVDGVWQDSEVFVDNGFSDKKSARASVGIRPFNALGIRLSYERTHSEASGTMRTPFRVNPQYVADYNNPRPEEIAWAKAAGRAGASATNAQAITYLRNRWRDSTANWAADNVIIYNQTSTVARFIGLDQNLTPYGWEYNDGLIGALGRTDLEEWGGVATFTPFSWLSLKGSYYKYDLDRLRNLISLNTPSADGVFRGSPSSLRSLNDSQTITGEAIANYSFLHTRNTTHVGASWYHDDFYRYEVSSTTGAIPLNSIPNDIRPSTSTQLTPGWNPFTQPYPDIRDYFTITGDEVATPTLRQYNREQAVYGSHILELFDNRLGVLTGGRLQKYRNDFTGFNVDAQVYTLGLSWEVKPDFVVYASKSTSFEPSTQAFVEGPGTTVAERLADPAPPRTGRGWDLGVKYGFLERRLVGTFTVFETTRVNDFRTVDQLRTDSDPRNLDDVTTNNVTWYTYGGERLSRGAELEVTFQPAKDYVIVVTGSYLPTAEIVANPSLARITLANGTTVINPQSSNQVGQRSAGSPEYKASLWNRYRFSRGPLRGLGVGYGIAYQAEVYASADPSIAFTVPSYHVSRAAIDYSVRLGGQAVDLTVLVTNLFNQHYYRGLMRSEPLAVTLRASTKF